METRPLTDLLDTAIRAAKAAGHHARTNKTRRHETAELFTHDIKLVLDLECQRIAEAAIRNDFPDHAILGEEEIHPAEPGAYEWVIDPIDGTVNFAHGFPYWCVSIAVRRDDEMLAACVFAPEYDECYTAYADGPACCNGNPIQASDTDCMRDAMLFTGISKYIEQAPGPHIKTFQQLVLNTRKLRITGSAALDLCQLAAGHADVYFEPNLYLWDHAAGGLIAQRAGACVRIDPLDHEPYACRVLCANQHLFEPFCALCDSPI